MRNLVVCSKVIFVKLSLISLVHPELELGYEYTTKLAQPKQKHNATQPQRCNWFGQENDFAHLPTTTETQL